MSGILTPFIFTQKTVFQQFSGNCLPKKFHFSIFNVFLIFSFNSRFQSFLTFVPGMKRRLYQYFFFLLLVILACGGADSLHSRNNDVQADSTVSIPTISRSVSKKNTHSQQNKFAVSHRNSSQYTRDYPQQQHILGELSDSDSEEEDTSETETDSGLLKISKADLWTAVFAFVNTFHTNRSAVYFAHSDLKNFSSDPLYIQYSVFRL